MSRRCAWLVMPGLLLVGVVLGNAGRASAGAGEPRVRIDHLLVTPGVTATAARVGRSQASDHLPVSATLTVGL